MPGPPAPRSRWQSTLGVDLHGKTLGVIGLGKIGSEVAKIGQAFGMRSVAWSPNLDADRAAADGEVLGERGDLAAIDDASGADDSVAGHLALFEAEVDAGVMGVHAELDEGAAVIKFRKALAGARTPRVSVSNTERTRSSPATVGPKFSGAGKTTNKPRR